MRDFNHMQDVLGQQPLLKTYSHLVLIFPLENSPASRTSAIQSIRDSLCALSSHVPWLTAKVVNEGSGIGCSGVFRLKAHANWSQPDSLLRVVDHADCFASYEEIVSAKGPATLLDGNKLTAQVAFPMSYQETDHLPAPVIQFQASLIDGGLLLNCAAQHNIINMNGIEQSFAHLATLMRGESLSQDSIDQANRDRTYIIPLVHETDQLLDHSQFRRPTSKDAPIPPPLEPESPFSWRYFRFSASDLARLKHEAMPIPGPVGHKSFISTNDALSAFCWQRVVSIRLARRKTVHAVAKFCRAVNARKTMGVPNTYMGDLVTIATSRMTFERLATAPLAEVAREMRADLNAVNTKEYIRSFAAHIARTKDKSTIVYGGRFNPDTDIGSSSWAQVSLANVDFGNLGKPSLIRRPTFGPLESDIYFMPRTADGDIDALFCFNDLDMRGLMEDETLLSYAEYIG